MSYNIEPIGYIRNSYKDKFGIPRQSNLVKNTESTIIFNEKYRDDNSLRGLEGYSHIWLLWIFSQTDSQKGWSVTVRPPRLGGNKRMGVFSTRSPYHPNRIGLSCVKIKSIEKTKEYGSVITVLGADLLDGTPIIDIKPYLTISDCYPEAVCGFSDENADYRLKVDIPDDISLQFSDKTLSEISSILSYDPRPSYHESPERIYSMTYDIFNIRFIVENRVLKVIEIKKMNGSEE